MSADYTLEDIQDLYKDAKYMRDDHYMMNLDYLTNFPSKIPHKIKIWMSPGKIPTNEVVEVTKDSKECRALVEDATKRVRVEMCSTKMTNKNWNDAVTVIKSTLKAYYEEYGRVCLREVSAETKVTGSLKTLIISVFYGHYTYQLELD